MHRKELGERAIEKLILIVDDSDADVLLLKRQFLKAGISNPVIRLPGGQEAIDYLEKAKDPENQAEHPLPTIVIVDLKMPGVDGFELLRWISSVPQLKRLFIIVLTGLEDSKAVTRAYD